MQQLAKHQKNRDLVSIYRDAIDDHSIQGFVLAYSEELVVLQYVYDFNLDGLMVIRTKDVTDIQVGATNKLQKKLLKLEGLLQQVVFDATFELLNWRSLISQLSKKHSLMIIESEALEKKDFFIGSVIKISPTSVDAQFFSGTAEWAKSSEKIKFKDITSCKVNNNYLSVYHRHFERNKLKN